MVRREIVAAKAGRARAWLNDAADAFDQPLDRYLRNRIAHRYAMLDYARVHAEARAGIPALREFLLQALEAVGL